MSDLPEKDNNLNENTDKTIPIAKATPIKVSLMIDDFFFILASNSQYYDYITFYPF